LRKLKFIDKNCYGCRMCQMACSFHHSGRFGLAGSSIRMRKGDGLTGMALSFDASCDSCKNRKVPYCVEYCPYGALQKEKKGHGKG